MPTSVAEVLRARFRQILCLRFGVPCVMPEVQLCRARRAEAQRVGGEPARATKKTRRSVGARPCLPTPVEDGHLPARLGTCRAEPGNGRPGLPETAGDEAATWSGMGAPGCWMWESSALEHLLRPPRRKGGTNKHGDEDWICPSRQEEKVALISMPCERVSPAGLRFLDWRDPAGKGGAEACRNAALRGGIAIRLFQI